MSIEKKREKCYVPECDNLAYYPEEDNPQGIPVRCWNCDRPICKSHTRTVHFEVIEHYMYICSFVSKNHYLDSGKKGKEEK